MMMRRAWWLVLALLLIGCQSVESPPAPVGATTPASTVATPAPRPCTSLTPPTQEEQAQILREIVAIVAQDGGDDAIRQRLTAWLGPDSAQVVRGDADGDGAPDLLLAWPQCGMPMLLFRKAAPAEPILLAPSQAPVGWQPRQGSRIDAVRDGNGDGRPEVVAEYLQAGGSATSFYPYVWQWRDGQVATLFTTRLNDWRGPNRWWTGDGIVAVQCRPMGPFQHKLSPHRQLTETYRWRPATGTYTLDEQSWTPPTVGLAQIDVAERLFYAGQYEAARQAYADVARFPADQADAVAWVPFSSFRMAEIDALLGRRAEALASLDALLSESPPLSDLARTFREAYASADAAAGLAAVAEYLRDNVKKETWPYLFDPPTIAVRPVIEDAFRRAGRALPDYLPEAPRVEEATCLRVPE